MTTFDRIELRMPQLMDELAPARVPDYVDDMLRLAARTPQRPAWSTPERWLPMGVIARIEPARTFPWRPVLVAVLVLVAAAAALALYTGAQRSVTLPPPFGPAANGETLISSNGDIVALDVATGRTTPRIAADPTDVAPAFAPDGRSFYFERMGTEPGIWVANADGSNARRVFDTSGLQLFWVDWSQSGDRLILMGRGGDSRTVITLVDPAGGAPVVIRADRQYQAGAIPFGRNQLILAGGIADAPGPEGHQIWRMDLAEPTKVEQLAVPPSALNEFALSPDGRQLVYATMEDGLGIGMNLRVMDLDSGEDRLVTTVGNDAYGWQSPEFLPDGKAVIAHQWGLDGTYQLGIVPLDGGPARGIGPVKGENGVATWFVSPDGKTVLATYADDGVADGVMWQIDVASGAATELAMDKPEYFSWQRAAGG